MSGSQCHNRNGDSGTGHVDGTSQRNGNGVNIRVEAQAFAQCHVDWNIGSGTSGEECVYGTFTETGENQRIWILTCVDVNYQRIDNQCYNGIAANEDSQQVYVSKQGGQPVGTNGFSNKTHNTKWSKMNNPGNHLGHTACQIIKAILGGFTGNTLEGDTDNDGPGEDTDIVGVNQRVYRIVYYIHQQGVNNFSNTTWRSDLRLSGLQLQCGREHERSEYPDQSCQECGDEIKHDNRLNGSIAVILLLEHSIHYQEEYQYRGYPFQCLDKEVTKNGGYRNKSRSKAGNTNTYNKTDCDLLDEGN